MELKVLTSTDFQTNSYLLIKKKEVLVIDCIPQLLDFFENSDYHLNMLLLTHIHFDHLMGMTDLQKLYDFDLMLSQKAHDNINNPQFNLTSILPPAVKEKIDKIILKNSTILQDQSQIDWGGGSLEVMSSPGHCDDSVMFIDSQHKNVFTGDTLFNSSIGRTDFINSSFDDILLSIKKLFSKTSDDFIVWPGHGPKSSVGFEKNYNPFLK